MDYVVQVALKPEELPSHIALQLGQMYLKRYRPNPAIAAIREFKAGTRQGALCWAINDAGKVLGWALRAKRDGSSYTDVMLFVNRKFRRMGIGDKMLDTAKRFHPGCNIAWYPHDQDAQAFFKHRTAKQSGKMP